MKGQVYRLSPAGVKVRADEMRPLIERLERQFPEGTYSFYGVLEKFLTGEWTCWIYSEDDKIDAVGATIIAPDMANQPMLRLVFTVSSPDRRVGGDRDVMIEIVKQFVAYADENEISTIEAIGRDGWTKDFTKLGFRHGVRVFTGDVKQMMEVSNGRSQCIH